MKNLFQLFTAGLLIFLASCGSQNTTTDAKVTSLLQSKEFTFMAERANPTGNDVINVLNSLPGSGASTVLNLDYGNIMEIKKEQIRVDLPYFGTMYTPNFNSEKNNFRFTTKNYNMDVTSGKKGSSVYTILPKDQQNVSRIVLEVYKNGKGYLSVRANDRQSISYDGYITANQAAKK